MRLEFQVPVFKGGYYWRDMRDISEKVVMASGAGGNAVCRVLLPILEAPDEWFGLSLNTMPDNLFRTFAALCEHKEKVELEAAIADFAGNYGMLKASGRYKAKLVTREYGGDLYDGETLLTWVQASLDMHRAVELLDSIMRVEDGLGGTQKHSEALSLLERRIKWETSKQGRNFVRYENTDSHPWVSPMGIVDNIAGGDIHPEILSHKDEVLLPARVYCADLASRNLAGNMDFRIEYHPDSANETSLCHVYAPRGLFGFMWKQFADVLTGEVHLTECQNPKCNEWFKVGLYAKKIHSKYCSIECKNAANNAKRPTTRNERLRNLE